MDDVIDDLKHLRQLYTTGPCAQSSSVLHQRSRTREILDGAIVEIERLRAELAAIKQHWQYHKLDGG